MRNLYTISIESLRLGAIIGVLPHEREKPQEIMLDVRVAYEKGANGEILDYAILRDLLKDLFEKHNFDYLENALDSALSAIIAQFGGILSIELGIAKTEIFSDCIVRVSKRFSADSTESTLSTIADSTDSALCADFSNATDSTKAGFAR